jgi:hypothetical protein
MNDASRKKGYLWAFAAGCFAFVTVSRLLHSDGSQDTRIMTAVAGIAAALMAFNAYRAFRNAGR